jgi:hypothetical protein
VNAEGFRRIALSMPEAVEAAHGGHPDFRVGKMIFATLGYPDASFAMVKLTPEQQSMVVAAEPKIFMAVPGGWGRGGATNVRLKAADAKTLKSALAMAWGNAAPAALQGRNGAQSSRRITKSGAKSGDGDLARAVARLRHAVARSKLPGVEEGASFGTPALKVAGKLLARVKDASTAVFRCPLEMKEVLIETAPEIYFETDHYKGWAGILVRLSKASDAELAQCLDRAWRLQAPKRLREAHERLREAHERPPPKRSARRTA